MINGTFDDDSEWTPENAHSGQWTISGGQASCNDDSNAILFHTWQPIPGKTYQVTFEMLSRTSGQTRPRLGNAFGTMRNAAGTYTETITAVDDTIFSFEASFTLGFTGAIDNVSVRQVLN